MRDHDFVGARTVECHVKGKEQNSRWWVMSEGPLCFIMPLICWHLTAITTGCGRGWGRGFRHMENWAFTFFADPLVFSPFVFQARMHEGSPNKIILSVYRSCFLLEMPKINEWGETGDWFILFYFIFNIFKLSYKWRERTYYAIISFGRFFVIVY